MSTNQDFRTFLDLAKRTRAGVLDRLDALPPAVLTHEHEPFAYGSTSVIQPGSRGA